MSSNDFQFETSNTEVSCKYKPNEAPIKQEYIKSNYRRDKLNFNFVSEKDKLKFSSPSTNDKVNNQQTNNETKRQLDENNNQNKFKRSKKIHGQNKGRFELINQTNIHSERINNIKLCAKYSGSYGLQKYSEIIEACSFGNECKFSHDVEAYMKMNPVYLDDKCTIFDQYGFCGFGHRCKFGKSHIDKNTLHNLIDREKFFTNGSKLEKSTTNFLKNEVRIQLRKKTYDFSALEDLSGPASIYEREWKKIDLRNKLFLAPLTTVGNLPFRRICKEYGADITCGEMCMADNIVQGQQSEWALLRRHCSEDIFGVQLTGSNPQTLAKATKLINDHCQVDFIDLNMGCPIDIVCSKGGGAALMTRYNKLSQIITSMSRISDVPLTLKMRAGLHDNKFTADKLVHTISNQFYDGRIAAITIHGRSKDARYTKLADWSYIRQCAAQCFEDKIPIFGSGDVFSWTDYQEIMNYADNKIAGVMIGRGALIKPWIFTEIKEQRNWDISSKERFDILKKYVNYGLEQFGSDNEGVEKTRKFLLEWLSFFYRYIPIGLLEVLPQKMNDRPPPYFGRDDLETLFASPFVGDWIKISEMFLGPVKENFIFLPKHKASAFSYSVNETDMNATKI